MRAVRFFTVAKRQLLDSRGAAAAADDDDDDDDESLIACRPGEGRWQKTASMSACASV